MTEPHTSKKTRGAAKSAHSSSGGRLARALAEIYPDEPRIRRAQRIDSRRGSLLLGAGFATQHQCARRQAQLSPRLAGRARAFGEQRMRFEGPQGGRATARRSPTLTRWGGQFATTRGRVARVEGSAGLWYNVRCTRGCAVLCSCKVGYRLPQIRNNLSVSYSCFRSFLFDLSSVTPFFLGVFSVFLFRLHNLRCRRQPNSL